MTEPATGTNPGLPAIDTAIPADEIARDAAVTALALALEHRWPKADAETLIHRAADSVDAALMAGEARSTILSVGNALDEHRLAIAVLRTGPKYQGEGPDHLDRAAAAQVITTLVEDTGNSHG